MGHLILGPKGPVPVSDVVLFENGSLSFGGAAGKRLHGYAVATLTGLVV